MKRISIILILVILVAAIVLPAATASANPDAGQGCHCHKMYGQAAADGLHNAFGKSDGKNGKATPCVVCHSPG